MPVHAQVNQFKLEGFLPEAMINYLCNLGWNDGTDQEIYTVDELVGRRSHALVNGLHADCMLMRRPSRSWWAAGATRTAGPQLRACTPCVPHTAEVAAHTLCARVLRRWPPSRSSASPSRPPSST